MSDQSYEDELAAANALDEASTGDQERRRPCERGIHVWGEDATAEGDTCECGEWYRFEDRIESVSGDETPPPQDPRVTPDQP
jgi:hypothetical protein